MKESEQMKKVKEALAVLEQRVARLSEEIHSATTEIIVRQEFRLVQQALDNLRTIYGDK